MGTSMQPKKESGYMYIFTLEVSDEKTKERTKVNKKCLEKVRKMKQLKDCSQFDKNRRKEEEKKSEAQKIDQTFEPLTSRSKKITGLD